MSHLFQKIYSHPSYNIPSNIPSNINNENENEKLLKNMDVELNDKLDIVIKTNEPFFLELNNKLDIILKIINKYEKSYINMIMIYSTIIVNCIAIYLFIELYI